MTELKRTRDLFSNATTFTEGSPDNDGLITIIHWKSENGHGSITLPEPYRIPMTPEELNTLGMSLLNSRP